MAHHHSYKASVKKLPKTSEVEIQSQISAAEFAEAVKDTLSHIKKDMELPGFRKGTAPEKLVREKIGEAALLKEAAEHAISHAYGHIIEAEKLDVVGYPKVSITKIAEGNPLEFTIVSATVPEITAFDYKKISAKENAKKAEPVTVADADVEKAIEDIKKRTGTAEVTDESVKKWGEFKDVADFKEKLRENIKLEKEHRAMEKKRIELVDALTKDLDVAIPDILIESELGRMTEQMRHDIERMGLKFEDYLKHLNKTADDLRKEWRADASKRVKLDLILSHVAKEEKISADKAKVEAEAKHASEHHKDVDPNRARSYFEHIFLNQAVFEFLEKQK
ncbi:MAG TPA: trigger factor [Candidatus Paceibacterota bacterium]|nr:trigger factor [Candidatus Paceibacterota bacterium]